VSQKSLIDYRTVPAAGDVDVRGAVIVEVDRRTQAIKAEYLSFIDLNL